MPGGGREYWGGGGGGGGVSPHINLRPAWRPALKQELMTGHSSIGLPHRKQCMESIPAHGLGFPTVSSV